jgi:signal transduction histidine kinase/AraC-like DNA-binding protein
MHINTKKEVSNRGMQGVIDTLIEKKFDMDILLDGIPYDLVYLKNKRERIEWWVYCKIIANLRPYFTQVEFEKMNSSLVVREKYFEAVLFGFFLFGSNRLARTFSKQIWKLGEFQFSNIKQKTEFLDKNKIRIYAILKEDYEFPVEFAYFTKGTWDELATLIGRKKFKVDFTVTKQLVTFDVSWDKEGFLFRISRVIRWFFNIKKALFEVTDTHAEMLQRYDQLQESKQILEKQTQQLKTAFEISTSIKQTLNINDSLFAITNTMVNAASFSAVLIELFEDIDENEFKLKVQTGEINEFTTPVHRKIIVNEKHIGNLTAYPNQQMDYETVNELVDYLIPVINIAIYNALVLRAIVDYRDNLEQKVSKRTVELQTAKDELAGTNELLKHAQLIQSNFYTNISHEFRTPLTLIMGPAKQLLETLTEKSARDQLNLIHRNAKRLNRLVDELLDISKIESGEMKLKTCSANLVSVVKGLALSFHSLAETKNITFTVCSDEDEIIAYIDNEKFDKILSNILSNAFKFTPGGGKVEIKIKTPPVFTLKNGTLRGELSHPAERRGVGKKHDYIEILITDTGIGIPPEQKEKIFDRFYQVDGSHTRQHEGTGIGLSLTKELIELHKGRIEVESEEGKGSTFKLFFPLGKEHLRPDEICEEAEEKELKPETQVLIHEPDEFFEKRHHKIIDYDPTEKPTLLIVEDNPDVRQYISMILESHYRIYEANDGEDGLEKSFEHIPDLIISDIMMPKMDGFRMCNILKSDSRTSHIPIIMLTAKATMEDKISGLELGADEYIMKPFEASELKARIKNLIEQRKRLHEHFRKYGFAEIDAENITPVDQQFLRKATDIISKNISDTSFGVEVLAESLAVSRSLLVKKVEALFGEAPNELIRRIRLNRAAKLIERKIGNVSQVALEVGFNNPSYFAECFKKQFGVKPSQYHKM